MKLPVNKKFLPAQVALEYMLLFTIVSFLTMVGLKSLLSQGRDASEGFYNKAAESIMGQSPNITTVTSTVSLSTPTISSTSSSSSSSTPSSTSSSSSSSTVSSTSSASSSSSSTVSI